MTIKSGIRLAALILWIFVTTIGLALLYKIVGKEDFFSAYLIREPYRWDFELMFAAIYFIWGIFLWRAARQPISNLSFIDFTIWANVAHGAVMIAIAFLREGEFFHLLSDSILFISVAILLISIRKWITTTSQL